jgi:hypothetical protein
MSSSIFEKFVFGTALAGATIGHNIGKTIIGDPEFESLYRKVKSEIAELKSLIDSNKAKLSKDTYFKAKAQYSSFDAKITRLRKLSELKELEREVKKVVEEVKKKC